ncbi:MAG: acyl-CoA dehydrogenase [Halioglobus sp.]|nr:acyl-CoA dehydrogenase [Halioglobus sp.]
MDFELNEEQQAVMEAVERLMEQQAGPARAIELNAAGHYDRQLHSALDEAGFSDIARDLAVDDKLAGLEAALVVEALARAGAVVSGAARIMVLPAVHAEPVNGPLALCTRAELRERTPVRFGAHAEHLLVLDENNVRLVALGPDDLEPVRTSFGYPMGRVADGNALEADGAGQFLGAEAVQPLRDWWRLSLAVEAVGTMEAALDHTVEYLKQRRQFGRPIGSFQAIQHRLSLCAIALEASRWLAREAAWHGARPEAAAAAAAFALDAADQLFTETHQMSGAIGFTHEFDLHVWSMRLLALRQELDGVGGARRALVQARWGTGAQ